MGAGESPREVDARGAQGQQIGDHNTQNNTYVIPVKGLVTGVVIALGLGAVFGVPPVMKYLDAQKSSSSASSSPSPWARSSDLVTSSLPAQASPSEEETSDMPVSSTPTTEVPTAETSSAAAFDPADLDDEDTDHTPLASYALLPASFTDSGNVTYRKNSSGVWPCDRVGRTNDVKGVLTNWGCTRSTDVVIGTYVDEAGQILVSVVVMPMDDLSTALGAHNELRSAYNSEWELWCPTRGAGSQVCSDPDAADAARRGGTGHSHRYLIHTSALYINLAQDSSLGPALQAVATAAAQAAGPQNYSGNQ